MSTAHIIGGSIELYRYVDNDTQERVLKLAKLPAPMAKDWEGERINVIDWKIDNATNTVALTYQTRNDAYAPILDAVLPVETAKEKLTPPNRSKNWKWNTFSGGWINHRTGERVAVY